MGINNLLKALKTIVKPRRISDYANMRVAVDTYCWIHKAIYSCALEIIEGRSTDKFIQYCIRRVEMLLKYNIKVVMVFDGGKLPMKRETEDSRQKKRAISLEKGQQYLKDGDREKAGQSFASAIDVTTEMANLLIKALQEMKIECIVAPYEADAQLAYLSKSGYVDVIITEDSDLLAFGSKKIFYKMDNNGDGQEICLEELSLCTEFSFQNWTNNMFLTLCIMAGCDYVDQIPQVGFKTAYTQIQRYKNYKLVISHFMQSGKYNVPSDYIQNFEQAFLTFRFQTVFDPISRKGISLNSIADVLYYKNQEILEPPLLELMENSDKDLCFLGNIYHVEIIRSIADGDLCPINLQPFPNIVRHQSHFLMNPNKKIEQRQSLQLQQPQPQTQNYNEKKQTFILQRAKKDKIIKSDISDKKQTTIRSFFKQKEEIIQEPEINNLLIQESDENISTQNKKVKKMKPFKTPAQINNLQDGPRIDLKTQELERTQEDDYQNQKLTRNQNQYDSLPSSQDILDQQSSQQQQVTLSKKKNQETYKYDDLIMKGINNLPIVLSQEILNRKLQYNDYGEYMANKITFNDQFNFTY